MKKNKKRKKQKFIWYYLLIGIMILCWGLNQFSNVKSEITNLKTIEVKLNTPFENITGRRKPADYKFYTNEYKSRFIILDGAVNSEQRKHFSSLKKGQIINIKIDNVDIKKLNLNKDVKVYAVKVGEQELLSLKDYNSNRSKYKNRLNILFMFMGLMALLKGIGLSYKKLYVVFIVTIILFVLARILRIGY